MFWRAARLAFWPIYLSKWYHFELYLAHFHVKKTENVRIFMNDSVQVGYYIMMLSWEKSSDKVVKRAALGRKHDLSDGFNNRILQEMVFKAQAVAVKEACDLLAWLNKILYIRQHGHSQYLHFHNNFTWVNLAVVLLHLFGTSLTQFLTDIESEFSQSFRVGCIQQLHKPFNQEINRMFLNSDTASIPSIIAPSSLRQFYSCAHRHQISWRMSWLFFRINQLHLIRVLTKLRHRCPLEHEIIFLKFVKWIIVFIIALIVLPKLHSIVFAEHCSATLRGRRECLFLFRRV